MTKSLVAIGDTHGRTNWKKVAAENEFDKLVLVGDYFDTRENITAQQEIENFRELLAYKKANPENVTLLFGNHDFHYLGAVDEHYSGFRQWQKTDIQELLHNAMAENLLQMCFVHEKYIFTHAGITRTWAKNNNIDVSKDGKAIENQLNDLFKYRPLAFRFTMGDNFSFSGDDICQSPIWVRPNSLRRDGIEGFVQVVGHTPQRKLVTDAAVLLIDTLGTSGEYLVITDGKPAAKN